MIVCFYSWIVYFLSFPLSVFFVSHPRGRRRIRERFGWWNLSDGPYFWIHGASVGEVRGLLPAISWVKKRYPECRILLTSFSVTGIEEFHEQVDEVRLLPFDSTVFLRRALAHHEVIGFLFGETEVWPALFRELSRRKVPAVLLNGRIELKSLRWFKRIPSIFTSSLSTLTALCVSQDIYKKRFLELGVAEDRLLVTGNAKYDRNPKLASKEEIELFRSTILKRAGTCIVTLGSVHPGEEKAWLSCYDESFRSDIFLVIVPRHIEKISYFSEVLNQAGVDWALRSETLHSPIKSSCSVLLVDTFGELEEFYAISQLAFVGGTLVPVGGHNPLEPALYGVPVVVGDCFEKVKEEVSLLQSKDGVRIVQSSNDVYVIYRMLLCNSEELGLQGRRSQEMLNEMRGSAARLIEVLDQIFHRQEVLREA